MLQVGLKVRQPESPTIAAAIMYVEFAFIIGRNLKLPQGNEYRSTYFFQRHPDPATPGKTEFEGVFPVRRQYRTLFLNVPIVPFPKIFVPGSGWALRVSLICPFP